VQNSAIDPSERETVVQIIDGKASIFTADLSTYRKFKRLGYKITKDGERTAWFETDERCLTFRRAHAKPREYTPEQREAMAARLKTTRLSRVGTVGNGQKTKDSAGKGVTKG